MQGRIEESTLIRPTQNLIKLVAFDFDGTLGEVGGDDKYHLYYPNETLALLNALHEQGIRIAIVTSSRHEGKIIDCLDAAFGKERQFLLARDENGKRRGIYSSYNLDSNAIPDGMDFKVGLIQLAKNDIDPSIQNHSILLADDAKVYRDAAAAAGILCVEMGMTNADTKPPIAYLSRIAQQTLLPIACQLLKSGIEKRDELKKPSEDKSSDKPKSTSDLYAIYKESEGLLRNAVSLFERCNDVMGVIKCHMELGNLYTSYHPINFSLPQDKRRPMDYRARSLQSAMDIVGVLESNRDNSPKNPTDIEAIRAYFTSAICLMSLYKKNGNPEALSSDADFNTVSSFDSAMEKFERAKLISNDLTLPQVVEKSFCLIM